MLYLVALTPVNIWAACEPCCVEDVRGVYLQLNAETVITAHASLQVVHHAWEIPCYLYITISDHTPWQLQASRDF